MQYIITRSFYEGGTLHEAGNQFTHEDATYVQKCLDDGNIAVVEGEAQTAPTPEPASEAATSTNPLPQEPQVPEVATENVSVQPTPEQIQNDLQVLEGSQDASSLPEIN